MTVKLRIDLSQGILEVEGEESFVREIHKEFQNYAKRNPTESIRRADPTDEVDKASDAGAASGVQRSSKTRKPARKQKQTPSDGQGVARGKVGNYLPMVLKELKLDGLKEFYQEFDVASHMEKILIFGVYLRDKQNLSVFTADHLFTCYRVANEKPPKAFLQAIRDASTKKNWLNYVGPDNISIVHIGETYITHDMKRKGDPK
ncbi:hypothetical protein [Mesorhizobium sp.]|uniref:hypothetical protein n=1 Tax=Mesorhizobium sp. TaxID=1871066 RepID=UPI000FE56E40|nr:hypothetical protein [Mesorhizobium sp.]RWN59725.1 MAG: hypothetical protein EOS00_17280 [Mesorhizobium sp.]